MNEEIDVSNCAFYNNGKCNNPNGMACNCRNNAICYYKELKRLEAQNRELKACLEDFNKPEVKKVLVYYHTGELDRLENKCEALEQENAKLKEDVNEAQEAYNFNRILYMADNMKLREALEKIKSFFNPEYNDYQTNTIKKMMKDIINEVLKDE